MYPVHSVQLYHRSRPAVTMSTVARDLTPLHTSVSPFYHNNQPGLIPTGEGCSGTMILSHEGPREGDMNDEICITQPLGGSIKAVNDLQGDEYCLMKYGAFDCRSLEQTDYVKFKTGGGDECLSLSDRPYTSYRWKKAIDGKVSRSSLDRWLRRPWRRGWS